MTNMPKMDTFATDCMRLLVGLKETTKETTKRTKTKEKTLKRGYTIEKSISWKTFQFSSNYPQEGQFHITSQWRGNPTNKSSRCLIHMSIKQTAFKLCNVWGMEKHQALYEKPYGVLEKGTVCCVRQDMHYVCMYTVYSLT